MVARMAADASQSSNCGTAFRDSFCLTVPLKARPVSFDKKKRWKGKFVRFMILFILQSGLWPCRDCEARPGGLFRMATHAKITARDFFAGTPLDLFHPAFAGAQPHRSVQRSRSSGPTQFRSAEVLAVSRLVKTL